MNRSLRFCGKPATSIALFFCFTFLNGGGTPTAQESAPLAGVWTLNRALSEMPREIGFNVNWVPPPDRGRDTTPASGGRGGRRGAGGGGRTGAATPFAAPRESYDDAKRVQLVTTEARNPSARLMIVDAGPSITITNELGQSRTLRPTGVDEWIDVEGVSIRATTHREADRLIVTYHAETDRDVRYTYTPSRDHQQLTVDVEFLEHGSGDKAKRVYQSGVAETTAAATTPAAAGSSASPPPSAPPPSAGKFDERPGAELRGLKALGVLVEDLSTQAVGCGLNHDALESALSSRLSTAGFSVRKNSDEDTYLYVNVMTTNMPNGTCVSRYDAFLYTHGTANLSYHDQPVLVQVSLMHRGGIASSAPMSHAANVTRGLENYVDLFVTQIQAANR